MRLLVFGRTGQVATELARQAPQATFLSRAEADLAVPGACAAAIKAWAPEAVINAAAWTGVDAAETAEEAATQVNGAAPGEMARACAALDIPFVHLSTDYVFDGAGTRPFAPEDRTGPLGAYGRSKLAGEEAVRAAGGRHAILRVSWVVSAHGGNFVRTMLRLGAERDSLRVVADQIGAPTPAADIADACLQVAAALAAAPERAGTYHFAGAPDVSWAQFAREILARAGLDCRVEDIPSSAWPTPAARPANSRLDTRSTEEAFGLARPDWRRGLDDILSELKGRGA